MFRSMKMVLLVALVACGGASDGGGIVGPPPARKPDPFLTVRVRDQLDTTTAVGRTQWYMFLLLTGPYDAQNGIAPQGSIGLGDVRLHHDVLCAQAEADSVGQRFITILAVGDTTTDSYTPYATALSIAREWYNGNHTLPAGYKALTFSPRDAWDSEQFAAGHGLVASDPIKWGFDWTGAGAVAFYERTDTDPVCNTF